jgi:cytochrome P450
MNLPPGPTGWPLLGMLPAMRRDPTAVYMNAAMRYGNVAYIRIANRHGYLVTDPRDIRHVLQDNARNYHKGPLYDRLRIPLGNGLVTSEDAYWLRQRRIAQPAFHRDRIAASATVMEEEATGTGDRWAAYASAGAEVDVLREMMHLTQTIVMRSMLGADSAANADSARAWSLVNEYIGENFWRLGLTDRWPTPRNRRFHRAIALLDRTTYAVIEEHRRNGASGGDLLSMLLSARDPEGGEGMTDQQLRDEVMTIFLAGHETTALALTWTWYLLAQHADCRARLDAELDTVLGGRAPVYSDLERLPYTRMVIEETMRLYPPAWGMSRRALAPDRIGGYELPAGWLVFIVPWVMHRHPKYWESPERFDPERFRPERVADRQKFVYLPFGAGPRQCIGNHFAMTEAHVILATLAQRYRLRLVSGQRIVPRPLITLRPRDGVRVQIEARVGARKPEAGDPASLTSVPVSRRS